VATYGLHFYKAKIDWKLGLVSQIRNPITQEDCSLRAAWVTK
jgi:hypothetical protein